LFRCVFFKISEKRLLAKLKISARNNKSQRRFFMKYKIEKSVRLLIFITILSLLPTDTFQIFSYAAQQNTDWEICEPEFIPEPTLASPTVIPFAAPSSEWDSSMPLPNRVLTATELTAWSKFYCEQGHTTEIEREILRLTNIERVAHSLPPLTINNALSRAARFKAQEMLDLDYFAHESPVYEHWSNIPLRFVTNHQGLGENLFALMNWQPANITAEFIVQGWMDSPGHRENILRAEVTELGVGAVIRPPMGTGIRNATATQIFGHAVSAPEHCVCTTQAEIVSVSAVNNSASASEFVDVEIRLNENPGLIALQLDVDFDRDILTAVSITPGTIIPLPTQPIFPIRADQPMGLSFEAAGFDNIFGTGLLATIRFQINSNANAGTTDILLNGILAVGGDPHYKMYDVSTTNGKITVEAGNSDSSVKVSSANATGIPGDFIDVEIKLDENPGIIALQLDVDFNRDILTAVSITPGTLIPLPTQPIFPISASQPMGLAFEAAGFSSIHGTGVLATIRFQINPNANVETTQIEINGIVAIGGEPIYQTFEISTTNGAVTIETGSTDNSVQVSGVNVAGVPGGFVDIVINLDENPGLIALQLDVDFNKDILTAISITPGTLLPLPTQPVFPIPAGQPMGLVFEAAGFENIYGTGTLATIRFQISPTANFGMVGIILNGILAISGDPDYKMFEVSAKNVMVNVESTESLVHVLALDAEGIAGEYVDVEINLASNPGLIALQLDVEFDRNFLTAVSLTPGTILPMPTQPVFPISANQPMGLIFESTGFENIYETGTLATIRFRINPNASGGTPILLDGILAMSGDPDYKIFEVSTVNGQVTTTAPCCTPEDPCADCFENPPTGVGDVASTAVVMVVFIMMSVVLWGYIIRNKNMNRTIA